MLAQLAAHARAGVRDERGGAMLLADVGDDRERLAAALDDAAAVVVAGELDGVVVGYVLARVVTAGDGTTVTRVEDLWVEPGARHVGVGERLLDEVVGFARARDCAGIDAVALPGARETKNFFESFGLTARAIIVHRRLG